MSVDAASQGTADADKTKQVWSQGTADADKTKQVWYS